MCPEPDVYGHRVLPHHPESVRAARGFVREVLDGSASIETIEAAETVVSELMTNAVVHAGTATEVEVRVEGPHGVYLAVTDGAPQHPVRPRTGVERSTGRGLALVGSLTREWGVALHPDRKVLWCHIGGATEDGPAPSLDTSETREPSESVVAVSLVNAPLVVYASWSEDAEALLRDYLLAGIEDADADSALRRHVASSQALALVVEGFAAVTADPVASSTVAEPGNARVTLAVPPDSIEDFETLNEVLGSAVEAAATGGEYLSAATSRTGQNFRRWLCREVLAQSKGQVPTPWVDDAGY